eukprot:Platyproteum_vivax@DN2443_c0_g1_i1.p1
MAATKGYGNMQDERERLLSLAEQNTTSVTSMESMVMQRVPEWSKWQTAGILSAAAVKNLESLSSMTVVQKAGAIGEHARVVVALFEVFKIQSDEHPIQYALTLLYETVRQNQSLFEHIIKSQPDAQKILTQYLNANKVSNGYSADLAVYLLTGLVSKAGKVSDTEVLLIISKIETKEYINVSDIGRLDGLGNLLKVDHIRDLIWQHPLALDFIMLNFDPNKSHPTIYKAAFCLWMVTFQKERVEDLLLKHIVKAIKNVLANGRSEKTVRLSLNIIKNLAVNDIAMEELVVSNLLSVFQLLEYEKWRDPEIYTEIQAAIQMISNKQKMFSNYSRYERELATGSLTWSFLHSEKFWHENVMKFEHDEFKAVKRLASLLSSKDTETLAVVCHDLGEFARLHPTGKKILQKLCVKEYVMPLMSHPEREIAREALLCIQKLMLHKWQDVGTSVPIN